MIHPIAAPFVDSRAADLTLSLTEPALAAEVVRSLETPDAQVQLRLLTASHQVVVRRAGDELIETLACLPSTPRPLPARYEHRCPVGDYRTTVTVHRLAATDLQRRVERLLTEHAADERYVVGLFPGHPLATTGVGIDSCGPGALTWRSWHAYPQEGSLVLTRSALRLRAGDRSTPLPAGAPR